MLCLILLLYERGEKVMKLEEKLIKLDEEDLFGKQKSVSTEQSDLLKNLAYMGNMIVEANDIIEARDAILYVSNFRGKNLN